MSLMQDNHVIQTLAADIPHHSFDIGVLPWTLRAMTTSSIPMCRTRCRNEVL